MALQNGHRFAVQMTEVFGHGLYAINVDQAMDFDEKTKGRTPSRDKVTDSLVWTVACAWVRRLPLRVAGDRARVGAAAGAVLRDDGHPVHR